MSHIPYATEHPDDDPFDFPDGSGIDAVFAERDALRVEVERLRAEAASQARYIGELGINLIRVRAALADIADAGPMFSPDDWRWQAAKSALQGASFDFPGKDSGQPEDGKIKALWGGSVSDDDVAEIFGAPV